MVNPVLASQHGGDAFNRVSFSRQGLVLRRGKLFQVGRAVDGLGADVDKSGLFLEFDAAMLAMRAGHADAGNGKVKYRIFGSSSTKNSAIKMQSFRQWKYKDFGNGFACSNSNIPGGVRSS